MFQPSSNSFGWLYLFSTYPVGHIWLDPELSVGWSNPPQILRTNRLSCKWDSVSKTACMWLTWWLGWAVKVMVAINKPREAESIDSKDVAVCHCYNIRQSHVRDLIKKGSRSVESLCEKTGAGSGCGGCRCRLQRLLMGLPVSCGPCSFCSGCGCLQMNCQCSRNWQHI